LKYYLSLSLIFVLGLSAFGQSGKSAPKNNRITLQPCEVSGGEDAPKKKALCGTLEVFESRALGSRRKIPIKIVVYPATGQNKLADPLFYIPGGPGSSATEDAPYVVKDWAKIRERRDLVFVDQRGTGGSNPLNCEFFNPADLQSYLGHWNPPDQVRQCRAKLEAVADLRMYVTSIAMDDLDDVRRALGYRKINIFGASYGARATQEYLKRYGKNVRAVILQGVSPTDQLMPRDFPLHTERALNGILDECAADAACRARFPNIRAEVKSVLETLQRGEIETQVEYPQDSKKMHPVKLSRDLAAEAVRYLLYQSGTASRVPLFLHHAAQGNFTPLAEAALFFRQAIVATGSNGMYLSVTCAEDLPWIETGAGERNGQNTFLGDYRLRQQREACELWTRGAISKDYLPTVRSKVPALIFTGEWDPVTPPQYGERLSKNLPNSLHVVVPSAGHGFGGLEGLDCVSKLTLEFINQGSAKKLDASCVQNIRRKGFLLELFR